MLPWWQQLTESFTKSQLTVEKPKEWGLADLKRSLLPHMSNLATLLMCPGGREWLDAHIQAGAARLKPKHHRILDEMRRKEDQIIKEYFGVVQEADIVS